MPFSTNRRDFLLATAAGAAALSPVGAIAIEPVKRTEGHHFKFSLAAYSYRELFGTGPEKLSLSDFIDDCAVRVEVFALEFGACFNH